MAIVLLLGLLVLVGVAAGAVLLAHAVGEQTTPAVSGAAVVAVSAMLAVGGLAVVGLGSARSDEEGVASEPRGASQGALATTEEERDDSSVAAALGPTVTMAAAEVDPGGFPTVDRPVGGLSPRSVLTVVVRGFEPFATARAEQCVGQRRCSNGIPVQFDGRGEARFQYLVTDDVDGTPGGCRGHGPRCTVVVRSGGVRAERRTVFDDRGPLLGHVSVDPRTGIEPSEPVVVTVAGLSPAATAQVRLCEPHVGVGMVDDAACSGTLGTIIVDEAGTASVRVVLPPCAADERCAVTVTTDGNALLAPVAKVAFARPPRPARDTLRLALGLPLAVALALVAAIVLGRTDWSAPGEAAAPEIDNVDYADLDAIIAALPEADEVNGEFSETGHPPAAGARQYS